MPPDERLTEAIRRVFPDAAFGPVDLEFVDPLALFAGVRPPRDSLPPRTLLRAEDLLEVEFRFVNLHVVAGRVPRLVRRARSGRAFLIAVFGPQHLLEQAIYQSAGAALEAGAVNPPTARPYSPPIPARIADRSRIVVEVADEQIEWSESGLLSALRALPLSIAPHAAMVRDPIVHVVHGGLLARFAGFAAFSESARERRRLRARIANRPSAADRAELLRLQPTVAERNGFVSASTSAGRRSFAVRGFSVRFGASSAAAAFEEFGTSGVEVPSSVLTPEPPRIPASSETAIELPWRLLLSPDGTGGFTHAVAPVAHDARVELWGTRLGTHRTPPAEVLDADSTRPPPDDAQGERRVRAIWTRDFLDASDIAAEESVFPAPEEEKPFLASLSANDRMQLVHLTSNHHWGEQPGSGASTYVPRPVPVRHLMLTSMGGWLDSQVQFGSRPSELDVMEWQHRATLGRDQFVKVVRDGVLAPFGHAASAIKITERRLDAWGRAMLFQRIFVTVREPQREYRRTGVATLDNGMPFEWVRILTDATPPLAKPQQLVSGLTGYAFMPHVGDGDGEVGSDQPFHFRMLAGDTAGHVVEFDGPLVFLSTSVLADDTVLEAANAKLPAYQMIGQRIAYAEPTSASPAGTRPPADDDLTLATAMMQFQAERHPTGSTTFTPTMRSALAPVPAMAAFTGQAQLRWLRYPDAFRTHGLGDAGNAGRVYLELSDAAGEPSSAPVTMDFASQTDRSGAFAAPSIAMRGLAWGLGPVGGDLAAFATNPKGVKVASMLDASGAKLFGTIDLGSLLPEDATPLAFVTSAVPATITLVSAVVQARDLVGAAGAELAGASDLVDHADALVEAFAAVVDPNADGPTAAELTGTLTGLVDAARLWAAAATASTAPRAQVEAARAACLRIAQLGGTEVAAAVAGLLEYGTAALVEQAGARLEWSTELLPWPASDPVFVPEPGGRFVLRAEVQAPLAPTADPASLVSCSMPPFRLDLVGSARFASIDIAVMDFSVAPGRKPDVDVQLRSPGIAFHGPLAFIESLAAILPLDGFSDPPYLDITRSGITSGFDLAVPTLAVGVFALSNIEISARLVVPFIGDSLEFRFAFASREDPFRLQVGLFAGGGFFAITAAPDGVRVLEAALEFGAAVMLSFGGVASGSVSVMAGIYFRLEVEPGPVGAPDEQAVELSGYFRARGEVDVIGLVSACIELYLDLTYREVSGKAKAYGRASVSVEISVCFSSFSVTVSCEKQFAGSSGDPTFAETMGTYQDALGATREPWSEYCAAFASGTA